MAGMNKSRATAPRNRTFEGARGMTEAPVAAMERVLFAHMLFEDTFYMDGESTANVLTEAVVRSANHDAAATAASILAARKDHNIRHASLLAAVTYAKHVKGPTAVQLIFDVIRRADELTEVIAMGASGSQDHGKPIRVPSAIRKGVARAFAKFDEYQFGKYNRTGKMVSLKDAVFLAHPSPAEVPLVQKIVDDKLATPDTWEVGLSGGGNKRLVFTNLLLENKLGAMALLRNLRNMHEAGVSRDLIARELGRANWSRVLPFRFMSAVMNAQTFARDLDAAFAKAVAGSTFLPGRTAVMVDTSGSMSSPISAKSEVRGYWAGACLGAAVNGDHVDLYEWASTTRQVPNFQSLSTAMALGSGAVGHGTDLGQAINYVGRKGGEYDRYIVLTDMQWNDTKSPYIPAAAKGYTINLRPYGTAGLVHGRWTHLNGWSDSILKYIASVESDAA